MQGTPQGEWRALYLTADRGLPDEEPVVVLRGWNLRFPHGPPSLAAPCAGPRLASPAG